jgi:hypothetical protein
MSKTYQKPFITSPVSSTLKEFIYTQPSTTQSSTTKTQSTSQSTSQSQQQSQQSQSRPTNKNNKWSEFQLPPQPVINNVIKVNTSNQYNIINNINIKVENTNMNHEFEEKQRVNNREKERERERTTPREERKSIDKTNNPNSSTSSSSPKKPYDKSTAVSHYAVGKTIGEGTFGKVKKGIHKLTGLPVAIKILEKDKIVDLADVERVKREIHILTRVRHPNVIRLFEVIDSPRHIFLIMVTFL